jgi:hypothetical protein
MTHARDYKVHLPQMKSSPELEADDPAYMVVFAGTVKMGVAGAPAPQVDDNTAPAALEPIIREAGLTGVVCVATKGSPTYYSSVDTSGLSK